MKKVLFIALFLSLTSSVTLLSPSHAFATDAASCQPVFNGGVTCVQSNQIQIDKQIKNPDTGNYVDNLCGNDPKYAPGDIVFFKLIIKNSATTTVTNIVVTDTLPQFIEFVSGDGTFDQKTNTFSITLPSLASGQEDVIYLQTKIVDKDALPASQNVICIANQASAIANNQQSQDNSQFCIQKMTPAVMSVSTSQNQTTKGGFTVYTPTQARRTPSTGPETWEILALLPTGALGFWLRRKTNNS